MSETGSERRRRKLQELEAKHGLAEVAERAGVSAAGLDQIIKGTLLPPRKSDGERAARGVGNALARRIEDAFDLGRGWFDSEPPPRQFSRLALDAAAMLDEIDDPAARRLAYAKFVHAIHESRSGNRTAAAPPAPARAPAPAPKKTPAKHR